LVPSPCRVSVGCARGVDALVRAYFRSSPSLLVFSVASGRFGSGRSAFARRSVACVRSVARGDRGLLVAFPSSPSCELLQDSLTNLLTLQKSSFNLSFDSAIDRITEIDRINDILTGLPQND
jgi:hypothetical protein